MDTETTKKSKIVSVIRWILFVPILLIQAGAFLESEYIAWVTGLFLCAFLTVHQDKIKNFTKIPYALTFVIAIVIFLTGTYIDMKN